MGKFAFLLNKKIATNDIILDANKILYIIASI